MLALHVDVLAFRCSIVVIFEVASEWFHSEDTRMHSTDAIQAGLVLTCQAMNCAGRRWKELLFASVDLDIDSFGHVSADVLAGAAL